MKDVNNEAFITLYKEAYKKCFGFDLKDTLSETESKHFSNKIFEETGLVIGAKSIKNYSFYIAKSSETKQENPSIATLDTFARYVLNAPYTDEVQRKDKEGHYPYWFQYRNAFVPAKAPDEKITGKQANAKTINKNRIFFIAAIILVTALLFFSIRIFKTNLKENFSDDFHSVQDDSLKKHGWILQEKDEVWWNRRNQLPSHLTLFTLRGDNWADSANNKPSIKNLLLRKITPDCFTAEIHLDNFVPTHKWQQAGILLLEDTILSARAYGFPLHTMIFLAASINPKK